MGDWGGGGKGRVPVLFAIVSELYSRDGCCYRGNFLYRCPTADKFVARPQLRKPVGTNKKLLKM